MKKPDNKYAGDSDAQVVQIHHVVEALEDQMIDRIGERGLMKYIQSGSAENLEAEFDALDADDKAILGIFGGHHMLHNTIHDIMSGLGINGIEEREFRKVAQKHEPRALGRMDAEMKAWSNKALERID